MPPQPARMPCGRERDGRDPRLSHAHCHAAPARIACAGQLPAATLHRMDAAEEQVQRPEAHDVRVPAGQLAQVDSWLHVENVTPEVHARRSPPRDAPRCRVVHDADDRLQQSGSGCGWTPLSEAQAPPHRHPSRSKGPSCSAHWRCPAGGGGAERVEILLAHHVVQVHAGARHDHAGALAVGARRCTRTSPSSTEMCVVAPGAARNRPESPLQRAPRFNSGVRSTERPPSHRRPCAASAEQGHGRAAPASRPAACLRPRAAGW